MNMAFLCRVYGYTPDQVRAMRVDDANTLMEYASQGRKGKKETKPWR